MKKSVFYGLLFMLSLSLTAQDSVKVYFDYGSANISQEGQQTLKQFAETITKGDRVSIDGYTDFVSSESFNLRLSNRRALAVKRMLLRFNSKMKIVHCKGNGKLMDKTGAEGRGNPKTRYVRVMVERTDNSSLSTKETPSSNAEETTASTAKNGASTAEAKDIKADATKTKVRLVKMFTTTAFLEKGDNVVLDNMNFHQGTAKFLDSATPTLEKLYETMRDKTALKIEIQGHICCYPSSVKHDPLALSRAKAVYDYLVEKGIDSTRITYTDFGASRKLVSPEKTEADKIKNRRVEIKIMDN